jgi:hypothetical protein
MHWAGVLGANVGRGNCRRFERHAAFRTVARNSTVDVRVHRADVIHYLTNLDRGWGEILSD